LAVLFSRQILNRSLEFKILVVRALDNMAFPVVEFSREGYKIRKVFG
jgi:hypothetical protein